jgi:uncharacterized BrkB/YihY/UPF0761 family membrane protein
MAIAVASQLSTVLVASDSGPSLIGGLIGFVIWVLILVWIYNIARRKGRHAVGWVIFGFFFSLIALVVVLVLPSKLTTDAYRPG